MSEVAMTLRIIKIPFVYMINEILKEYNSKL
jgi:hypothetical protein